MVCYLTVNNSNGMMIDNVNGVFRIVTEEKPPMGQERCAIGQ